MIFRLSSLASGLLALLVGIPYAHTALAQSDMSSFACGGGGVHFEVMIDPAAGMGLFTGPGYGAQLVADERGAWANADYGIGFYPDDRPPALFLGSEQFSCADADATPNNNNDAEGRLNSPGQSLGGRLRAGPGTDYAPAGSLAEGSPITLISNTGVSFNGYDWFEVRTPEGSRAYQWGGILCSEGQLVPGVFEVCGEGQASPPASGSAVMAFAVDATGRFGHGLGMSRTEAERFALEFCGAAGCRIADVTTEQCHAMAEVPGGYWFGSAPDVRRAEALALGMCVQSGATSCRVAYSFCR
ncbi:DUF4189 domain-containing protein [Pelagibacterium limicola]|uniref:DUF4189 domain-containing protein n=1 Tax=Pelagibacterium limicola TaxID=2791022 RepID=UPI0018AFE803|nr:DUF4189 domain-containing protein [Pelagibacterium limicola]